MRLPSSSRTSGGVFSNSDTGGDGSGFGPSVTTEASGGVLTAGVADLSTGGATRARPTAMGSTEAMVHGDASRRPDRPSSRRQETVPATSEGGTPHPNPGRDWAQGLRAA